MCLFRCRGATPSPALRTVMRFSCRWPRTLWPAKIPRPFKALVVLRVRIGDVDLPVHRVDDHVIEDSADTGESALRPRDRRWRLRHGIDDEDVLGGGREFQRVVIGTAKLIDP